MISRWIGRKLFNKAVAIQLREITDFVERLKVMDAHEIGLVVASATHYRHTIERNHPHWNLLEPVITSELPENPAKILHGAILQLQKSNKMTDAAALMVWLHTLRAGKTSELRQMGRDLWRQLSRGFPHCEESAADHAELFGFRFNTDGYGQFPGGLTPDPL